MSQLSITALGNLGQFDVTSSVEDQYTTLREKCLENYGPDFCNSVLPRTMVYALTRRGEGYTLPWWAWMLLGGLAARLIR